ncbi:Leucine-rich repeat protein kinase family protein [Thalictrum thalictroides]|uniref:Leucine-rich repeat protein kinase family protein n=1 Tax=Thalictrum thalictroides TaxID=46969 RepID=A0A7J6VFS9_THATH|nr:Leucine-rich repeat protein kinase family protein [Thalictrum thalictroides]
MPNSEVFREVSNESDMFWTGQIVSGSTPEIDREVLLNLKSYLMTQNKVNQGSYKRWNQTSINPCEWPEINCTNGRVTGINLSNSKMSGSIFYNFSALTELQVLDLSQNTIGGEIPADLNGCSKLTYLNLSQNLIGGELNLTGLKSLKVLDLTVNRFTGGIQSNFPALCENLITLNISSNNFTGGIENCFDECPALQYLDLSSNNFTGQLWLGFPRLREFSVSENNLTGDLPGSIFTQGCNLNTLDLSENHFHGEVPKEVANCGALVSLVLWGNSFTGLVPYEIGSLSKLEVLILGTNQFKRDVPESLLNCSELSFFDMSKNSFGGDIQEIFGRLKQVKFLVLHGNSYTGGIHSSGILKLPNILRLDLSFNNFASNIPVEFSTMSSLKFLYLAQCQFTGNIPLEFGNLSGLQALDLSSNKLTGTIPPTLGKLTSLLWLMLANNSLTGEIPAELGNCGSLLWLNLANNQLSGKLPPHLANMGLNITPTFMLNRQSTEVPAGSGECSAMRRWLPADYPPFSFVYTLLTRKKCRSLWDQLLKGYGIFPICVNGSTVRTFEISGYLQLSGNKLTGKVPPEVGRMENLSLIHLGMNNFSGNLPQEISRPPLVVLNITSNHFSGELPSSLGSMHCLQNLDLSFNNFSGMFPQSLGNLNDLNKFNISYNPLISGWIPSTGQLATFERDSFLGDPLLILPFQNTSDKVPTERSKPKTRKPTNVATFLVLLVLTLAFLVCALLSVIVCSIAKKPANPPDFLLEDPKYCHDTSSSSCGSSPLISDSVKIIRLDKTAFTYADILKATGHFSEERIIGKGGFGTVYRGMLPDGREVAVKKLQRDGVQGEREFRAEMEVLSGTDIGWPHPNLVASNVLLDREGTAHVTDFGLARVVGAGDSHVSTIVAGTIGYVAPEYGQTWHATTKGDVYSFGVLAMELATARRAVDGGEECLLEWAKRVIGDGRQGLSRVVPVLLLGLGITEGAEEMCELLKIGLLCTAETPQARPNMKEVLLMLIKIYSGGNKSG